MKIAYAGFDLFYPVLEYLVDNKHDVFKIFSCRTDNVCEFNTRVTEIAKNNNIPITYERITLQDLEELRLSGCDALIVAGYYYRIPIDKKLKMLNIHPAYLPVGRGAWPMPVTILNGFTASGVTIHKMEASFDTGDILIRREFSVSPQESLVSFMEKIYAILPEMLDELFADFDKLYENALPQGEGEYWECPNEADYVITERSSFQEADLILRAFMGYECIYKTKNRTYALQYGKAVRSNQKNTKFPIDGGYIEATKAHEI